VFNNSTLACILSFVMFNDPYNTVAMGAPADRW
jgi:hypothetical protein